MTSEDQLIVRRIKNGTVLDHLPSGTALLALRVLGILDTDPGSIITVAMNVPSVKLGRKDIVKIENKYLTPDEANRLALIAPQATINLIQDYKVVEKRQVELPHVFEGIFKCPNPTCITNSGEHVQTVLEVIRKRPTPILRCHHCQRIVDAREVLKI